MLKDETLFGRAKDAYGDIDIFITKANMEKQYYNRKRKEKRKRRAKRKRKLMSR
jgi:rRNA processing protein Gar1